MGRCDETLGLLYHFLDRELSADEQAEVQRHLENCPPCRDQFRFEEDMLILVRRCCRDVSAPPSLVEKVRRLCDQSK